MQFRVYNKTLDKNLWDENKQLNPEVRATLLQIAKDYYEGEQALEGALEDAYVVGSSANYNWTPDSDIDLHLVVDASQLDLDEEQARSLFELMAHKWNQTHDIKIKGHKVELYIQDINHEVRSSGIYSLTDGEWVTEPHPEKVDIDEEDIKKKYRNMAAKIDDAIQTEDVAKMKKVMEDLRNQRNTGLDKSGEFSAENIVFKMLRKFGYIGKLKDATHQVYDREMTLTEKLEDPRDLIIGYVTPSLKIRYKTRAEIETHSGFTEVKSWYGVTAWRYRKDLNLLFWWKPHSGEINENERDAVIDFLEHKFGARNIKQRLLIPGAGMDQKHWDVSHGIEEMADLSMKGKTPHSGDIPLKDLPIEHAKENVVVFRNPTESFFPAGFTLVYFMDTNAAVEGIKHGDIPYLMVPRGTFYSGGSPITDIWKKKFQKPGTEHILGVLEGVTNEQTIYVDMITVRPGWQRNKIATRMMNELKSMFPTAKVETSSTTDKGEKFFKASMTENTNKEPYEVRKSEIPNAGKGLFATRDIPKGEIFMSVKGVEIPDDQWKLLQATKLPKIYGFEWGNKHIALIGKDFPGWIGKSEKDTMSKTVLKNGLHPFNFVNDGEKEANSEQIPQAGYVMKMRAIKPIRNGEEITKEYDKIGASVYKDIPQ